MQRLIIHTTALFVVFLLRQSSAQWHLYSLGELNCIIYEADLHPHGASVSLFHDSSQAVILIQMHVGIHYLLWLAIHFGEHHLPKINISIQLFVIGFYISFDWLMFLLPRITMKGKLCWNIGSIEDFRLPGMFVSQSRNKLPFAKHWTYHFLCNTLTQSMCTSLSINHHKSRSEKDSKQWGWVTFTSKNLKDFLL